MPLDAILSPVAVMPGPRQVIQAVLYWDNVRYIVPYERNPDIRRPEDGLDKFAKSGLLDEIPLTEFARDTSADQDFLAMLDSHKVQSFSSMSLHTLIHHRPWGLDSENLTEELIDGLACRDLVRTRISEPIYARPFSSKNSCHFLVQPDAYPILMTYITGSICRTNPGLLPLTDSSNFEALTNLPTNADIKLSALRKVAIDGALPVPSWPMDVKELASFKNAHRDQLIRLIRYLNGRMADLASINDEALRQGVAENILEDIRDDVAFLRERMGRRNWPRLITAGLGGIIASGLLTGAGIAAGGHALVLGLGLGGGVASFGPAVYQAVDLLRPQIDSREPLAYAALARDL